MAECGQRSNIVAKKAGLCCRRGHRASNRLENAVQFLPILAARARAMLQPMPRPTFAIPRLSLPVALLLCLGIIAVAQWLNHAMGHPLICKCGYVKFWHSSRGDSEMSQHLTDWYTYSHVLHGIIFYWLLATIFRGRLSVAARLVIAALIEGGWEVFENTPFIINRYRAVTISRDYFGDSIVNSTGDILAMVVGFLLASRFPAWVTVFLLIATEVILLALIRDNLTLNIIMLVHPVEWIKQWQLAG
jgi:Protein of unknown function (DUF2585)